MTDDRLRLRTTFDSAADLYHGARPDYPEQLYDALVEAAGLDEGDELLEIGCGTGKATLPLARRGFRIICVFPDDGDPFLDIQEVYDAIGEGLPADAARPRPGELPDDRDEIERSGLFEEVVVRHFDWEIVYDAEQYLRLLGTFSGHIAMEASKRDRLYAEIRRRLGRRSNGRLRRHWGAVLQVARRVEPTSVP